MAHLDFDSKTNHHGEGAGCIEVCDDEMNLITKVYAEAADFRALGDILRRHFGTVARPK